MPKFKITDAVTGKAVTVSGESAPSHEEAEQIFKDAGLRNPPPAPSTFMDAAKGFGSGLLDNLNTVLGNPNIVGGIGGVDKDPTLSPMQRVPGSDFSPQTTVGKYAKIAGQFAPAVAGGEASLPARIMGRVLAPAAGAQLAGSAVDENTSPTLHGALSLGGALVSGGLAGGARALGQTLLEDRAPEAIANTHLGTLLKGQGIAPQDISQNAVSGRGQLGAEAMGPNGVAMLATLGRRPGATGEALANALTTRGAAAPARMMDDFTSATGIDPRAAQGNFDEVLASGQKRAAPLYAEAYKQNANVASPMLDKILETPAGKKALSDARVKMQNDMSLMGTPDAELMDQAKEGGTLLPSNGAASGMKLRVYDYVKRSLDDQIDAAYRSGNKNEGNIIRDLKGKLVSALDNADITASAAGPNSVKPEGGMYAQARAAAGDYLGAKQAFEDGQSHILSNSVSADDVAKYTSKLSPTALEAYKGGMANKVLLQAQNGRLTPRLVGTPAVQLKLAAAIGPDKAQQFIDAVQQEGSLAKTGARMMPGTGSITSDVLLNSGEQDSAAMLDAGMSGAKALGHALQGNVMSGASHGISAFQKLGDLRRSATMAAPVRNELGRLLMLPPQDLAAHLQQLPAPVNRSATALATILGRK